MNEAAAFVPYAKPIVNLSSRQIENFWKLVAKGSQDECWKWKGHRFDGGYGCFRIKAKKYRAHRVSFTLTNGPIRSGMCLMHKCDNPICCNPSHLVEGTYMENNRDMRRKGRAASVKGPITALAEERVREIAMSTYSNGYWAFILGVNPVSIANLRKRYLNR